VNQLIETSDFDVGPWRVRPSRAQLEAPGQSVRLEPRVMGVLVALARRRGETVAREQLIAEVWEGRVVTDDAVQRCIAALRKVLRSLPGADIETIPRLGYALRVIENPSAAVTGAPVPSTRAGTSRSWVAAAVAFFIAVGAISWWMSSDIPASSRDALREPRAMPLTALRGREVQPALSPSGGQVAFVWSGEDGSNSDIYVKVVNGDGQLRLTDDPARDVRPAWSPDGGEIAFARVTPDACTLLRVPAIGGAARRIAPCARGQVRALDWSPDSRQLALVVAGDDLAPASLRLIDVQSGEARSLSALEAMGAGIEDARFSPDGELLAFTAARALGVEDVHVYRFEDRVVRRLTFDQLKVHNLDWAADGRAIVFSSNRGGPFRLWRAALDGTAPEPVEGAGDAADDPSVAANGRIAYEVWREDAEIMRFDLAQPQAAPQSLLASTRFEWDAKVSPDGERIAYVSDQSGAAEVWLAARDGGSPQRLTAFAGPYTHSPRWSPDGAQLAFVSPVSGRMNLFALALADGHPRRVGDGDVDYFAPTWTPDGSGIVAGGRRASSSDANGREAFAQHSLWLASPAPGPSRQVGPVGARTAQFSVDGSQLYYTRVGMPGIWRRDAAALVRTTTDNNADERVVADLTPVDWNNWLVASSAIWYVRRAPSAEPELMRYDLAARTTRAVRALPGLLYKSGLWVSADERELIATVVLTAESDVHIVEPGE